MNSSHLGDALDYWKGAIVERLTQAGLLKSLAVDPMLSDTDDWNEESFQLYADLLNIQPSQIIRHSEKLWNDRIAYFKEINHHGDLFIDPDIGVKLTNAKSKKHLQVRELKQLLVNGGVVIVYQHIRGITVHEKIAQITKNLNLSAFYCTYKSPSVALIFFSLKFRRVEAICRYFTNFFKKRSESRTCCGKC